jgi:23S rRNA pseudouridine1911/1915/1917 synthase
MGNVEGNKNTIGSRLISTFHSGEMPEFPVDAHAAGERLDLFLAAKVPHLSRSRLQALIRQGHVTLAGKPAKPGDKVRAGATVAVTEPPAEPSLLEPEDIPLDILYEDADLLVLNKPAGLVVHPAAGHARHTLVHALLAHCASLSGIGGEQRPGIVHRLDKDTSGCLVVAINDTAHAHLSRQFAGRSVTKIYLALVQGCFAGPRSGSIENQIGRHPVHRKKMAVLDRGGRSARTTWRVAQELPGVGTLVECTLHTGRTHQIRVHLKHLGHPLLGDALYAPRMAGHYPRQMLHAWKLGFTHPRTGKAIQFCSPLPEDFRLAGVRAPPG